MGPSLKKSVFFLVSYQFCKSLKRLACCAECSVKTSLLKTRNFRPFHHHHQQSLDREGRWGTTDDFATSFLYFFPVLHCPLGLAELRAFPFPDVVFPPLPLSVALLVTEKMPNLRFNYTCDIKDKLMRGKVPCSFHVFFSRQV